MARPLGITVVSVLLGALSIVGFVHVLVWTIDAVAAWSRPIAKFGRLALIIVALASSVSAAVPLI